MSESQNEQLPQSSENASSLIPKPKPSGIKPPSSSSSSAAAAAVSSSLARVNRICLGHEKKAELPTAATPNKSEYIYFTFYYFSVAQMDQFMIYHIIITFNLLMRLQYEKHVTN